LIKSKDKFKVNLVGTGELFDSYRQQVKQMGVEGSVKFWGRIKNIEDGLS